MHFIPVKERTRERERQRECLGGEGREGKEGNRYHSVTVLLVSRQRLW